ncbi:GlcG/HbpS family heme-binding protein [Actinophytocola sp.]|uniref:GlcG/HbpS family heme-binding protein n=1 Tax=Actinophytocola sp. TaxID=1872138 RepID=UPI002D5EDCF0|nr:heme-binding protein [Actinophytocola sp.]HYQ68905.1 heme-binding protein [Actinophytocola sp.]
MPVTLREAHELINSAHRRAQELGTHITVAVVDEGGHLQALGRMDGAPPLSAGIAEHKAASVALIRRDGAILRQMQEAWPAFFSQLDRAAGRPILAGAGSLLIQRADTVMGAIAVSGGLPQQDDECAEAGLAGLAVGN